MVIVGDPENDIKWDLYTLLEDIKYRTNIGSIIGYPAFYNHNC